MSLFSYNLACHDFLKLGFIHLPSSYRDNPPHVWILLIVFTVASDPEFYDVKKSVKAGDHYSLVGKSA